MRESEIKKGVRIYKYQGDGRVWDPEITNIYDNGVVGIRWGNASTGYAKADICRNFTAQYPSLRVNLWKAGRMLEAAVVVTISLAGVLAFIALAGKVWRLL